MNYEAFLNDPVAVSRVNRVLFDRSTPSGDCLLWGGAVTGRGYGQLRVGPNMRDMAHRIAWAIANNQEPPAGMHVMHSCDTPLCINPEHLSIGTPSDNAIDFRDKKQARSNGLTLLEKAQSLPAAATHRYDTIIDTVECLRGKGWTFRAIHEWLLSEEQNIHPNWITFASAMCQRIQNRRNKNQ